jgi:hypothetical protein
MSNNTGCDELVPEDNLIKKHTKVLLYKDPSSFFKICSWPTGTLIALGSYCTLLIPGNVLRHLDVTFNGPTPLSQLLYHPGTLVRFRLSFLSFLKGVLAAE